VYEEKGQGELGKDDQVQTAVYIDSPNEQDLYVVFARRDGG
jgi:hypothetical protein